MLKKITKYLPVSKQLFRLLKDFYENKESLIEFACCTDKL